MNSPVDFPVEASAIRTQLNRVDFEERDEGAKSLARYVLLKGIQPQLSYLFNKLGGESSHHIRINVNAPNPLCKHKSQPRK